MRHSLIFFKTSNSAKSYAYRSFDCCEALGAHFQSTNMGETMYVAVPITELDDFFVSNKHDNLRVYLELITECFDITYSLATEEEAKTVDLTTCSQLTNDKPVVIIKVNTKKGKSNKYFNVAYNAMRYIWYEDYTNMAIIATNLYNMHIAEDPMDILAIAFSYQKKTDRAILPTVSANLEGLLFFRNKAEIIPELQRDVPFNNVFWRYPVYFNPIVKVKGTFFEDAESTVEAKGLFAKLEGMMDVNDLPKLMIKNISLVYKDYMLMKEQYLYIREKLNEGKYTIDKNNPVLLQKGMSSVEIIGVDPTGYSKKLKIMFVPSVEDVPVVKKHIHKVVEDLLF